MFKFGVGFLIIAALIAFYYFVRIRIFTNNAVGLHSIADNFATDYTIGKGEKLITYVALGDSTAYGIGVNEVEDTLPYGIARALSAGEKQVRVINLARSGAQIKEVLEIQLPRAEVFKPDIISISVGGNDATHLTRRAEFEKTAQDLLTNARNLGAKVIFASSPDMMPVPAIPPVLNWIAGFWSARQSSVTKGLVAKTDVIYVDLFSNAKLTKSEWYASDSFHPNKAGYDIWLKEYLKEF